MALRQEHGARAEVVAADFRRGEGLGVADVGVADDRQVVAERLDRAEAARRQVEVAARLLGRPHELLGAEPGAAGRAVHDFNGGEAHPLAGAPAPASFARAPSPRGTAAPS